MKNAITLIALVCFVVQIQALIVTVKDPNSANEKIDIPDDSSVMDLKKVIEEKFNIVPEDQRLVSHDGLLEDTKKMMDYHKNFFRDAVDHSLHMQVRLADNLKNGPRIVFIDDGDKTWLKLHLEAHNTVREVKDKILALTNREVKHLKINGQKMDDSETLEHYKLYAAEILKAELFGQ